MVINKTEKLDEPQFKAKWRLLYEDLDADRLMAKVALAVFFIRRFLVIVFMLNFAWVNQLILLLASLF